MVNYEEPYMNGELRRAINGKNMLKRRYERCKSQENWKVIKQIVIKSFSYVGKS